MEEQKSDVAREKEKRQRRDGTGTVCQSDAQSCGVHGVTHTTEPSVEATCLIMGNVCIWGRLWLAHSQHGQGKWHTGNYYYIMLASCTHCMHTYCTERESFIEWARTFWK